MRPVSNHVFLDSPRKSIKGTSENSTTSFCSWSILLLALGVLYSKIHISDNFNCIDLKISRNLSYIIRIKYLTGNCFNSEVPSIYRKTVGFKLIAFPFYNMKLKQALSHFRVIELRIGVTSCCQNSFELLFAFNRQ